VLLLLRHVLRAAVAEGNGVRLLVLATYRDTEIGRNHALAGVMADVRRLPGVEQLAMAGLSAVEVAELVSRTAGHALDDDGRRLAERLHAETDGNPFFVNEIVRLLVSEGRLERWEESGSWSIPIPQTVHEVVDRRLDRLSESCSRVLSIASAVGREFQLKVVEPLA